MLDEGLELAHANMKINMNLNQDAQSAGSGDDDQAMFDGNAMTLQPGKG